MRAKCPGKALLWRSGPLRFIPSVIRQPLRIPLSWIHAAPPPSALLRVRFSRFFVMALLDILRYPDPRLHKVARPVVTVDDSIRQLVRDMAETMYAAPGIGLAATQVDVHERVVTIDVSEEGNQLQVFINPEITWSSPECKTYEEGCLSIPGIFDEVKRPAEVNVRALNEKGEAFEIHADGLLAVCIQHEIDHLNGKVFVEYLSNLKQNRIRTKLKKAEREAQRA